MSRQVKPSSSLSRHLKAVVSALALSAAMVAAAGAQPVEEEIVVTGVRSDQRTVLTSPVPVDVFTGEALAQTGAVGNELGQAIATVAPSFNFSRQSTSGPADHVRPGQLRGLSPDQTLVLVNGHRRHRSAVVQTEAKIGRGTAPVDFNTIPLGAVGRIEVLRDGAGAQYGSDAIAGVINIILDDAPEGVELNWSYGAHVTDVEVINQDITDGETLTLAFEGAFPLGSQGGFVRAGWEIVDRESTNRAGFDQIPPDFIPVLQTPANLALRGQRNYAVGDPETAGFGLWYNARLPVAWGEAYSYATFAQRNTREGGAFFRYPDGPDNELAVYPTGFRPRTTGDNEDLSVTAGLEFQLGGFEGDAALTYGRNEFEFGVTNSLNPSLGVASPTSFNSGAYILDQTTFNLDFRRDVALAVPVTLAFGAEYRNEGFETEAGDLASYQAGPVPGRIIGAQAAEGLTPADVVDLSRDVYGVYVDLGADVTDRLFVNAAARYEDYEDFGDALTGKLSGIFTIVDGFNVRAAVSNSVRAPGLQQIGFSDTTFSFAGAGGLVRTRTLRNTDPIARALGVAALDPEESVNYSLGFTANPVPGLTLAVDAFQINVDDRITLSENISGNAVATFVSGFPGAAGIRSVRFFSNAVDTETRGVDVVANYDTQLWAGDLALSLAYTYAETEIERFAPTPAPLLALDPTYTVLNVEEVNTIETAAPTDKVVASAQWSNETWRFLLRGSYYGEVERVFGFASGPQVLGREFQLDAEAEWYATDALSLTAGASNLLDEYPDPSNDEYNYFGNLAYDFLSPIGVNGRFVYVRARVRL